MPESTEPSKPLEVEVLAHYKKGRTIRSVAFFDVQGTGTNTQWYVKGTANFVLRLRMVGKTTVTANNGSRINFELEFQEVVQELAHSQLTAVKIEWPEKSVLTDLVESVLSELPIYRKVRWGTGVLETLDPGMQTILTTFAKALEARGVPLHSSAEPVELAVQVQQLSGKRLKVEYVNQLGVTRIEVLNDQTLPRETLANLAHNSSLLMDHYLFPNLDSKPGESWDVDARDVAGLIGAGFEASASGEVTVRREKDTQLDDAEVAHLRMDPSSPITLKFREAGGDVFLGIKPKESDLYYSRDDFLIRRGKIRWHVDMRRVPAFFLLRGTRTLDAECKSYYEAELQSASKTPAKGD